MSIIIQNISEENGLAYGRGKQKYVLRINKKVIALFEHNFQDGLGMCLQKAAQAAVDPNREERQQEMALLDAIFKAMPVPGKSK